MSNKQEQRVERRPWTPSGRTRERCSAAPASSAALEHVTARCEQDAPRFAGDRLQRGDHRLRLHHHSLPAAVRRVVGDAMLVGGEVADTSDFESSLL
jgi:hypothetical protein